MPKPAWPISSSASGSSSTSSNSKQPVTVAAARPAFFPRGSEFPISSAPTAALSDALSTAFMVMDKDEIDADEFRVLERLRAGGEDRTDADVTRSVQNRLSGLFDRVGRDPDQTLGADDSPGIMHCQFVLSDVNAVGITEHGEVRPAQAALDGPHQVGRGPLRIAQAPRRDHQPHQAAHRRIAQGLAHRHLAGHEGRPDGELPEQVIEVRHGLAAEKSGIFLLGCIVVGLALVGLVRAAISSLTDIDTRDRKDFEPEPLADEKPDNTESRQ